MTKEADPDEVRRVEVGEGSVALPSSIKPPGDLSNIPDKYTRKAFDMTGSYADHRVFFINTKFFKYGTTDQGHAAALVLSAMLLAVILFLGSIALASGSDHAILQLLIAPFSLVAGVAVGKSLGSKNGRDEE